MSSHQGGPAKHNALEKSTAPTEATLLARAAALHIKVPADRRDAVLESARRLDQAGRRIRDALARMAADAPR